MKTTLRKFTISLLLGLLTFSTRATTLFQDSFNYPNGTLTNSTWVAGSGSTIPAGDIFVTNGNTVFIRGASGSDLPRAYFTNAPAGIPSASGTANFPNTIYWFSTNNGFASAIYFSLTLNAATAPVNNGVYFAYLTDTNFNFRCATFVTTNHAAPGTYRFGIIGKSSDPFVQTNTSGTATNIIQRDLIVGQNYFVLAKYSIDSGICTLWVNPTNEASTGSNVIASTTLSGVNYGFYDQAGTTNTSAAAVGLRSTSTSTSGNLLISNLVVTTSYNEGVPAIPQITVQPQDNSSLFIGNTLTLQTLAVANSTVSYQWYFVTNSITNALTDSANIVGSSSNILVLSNIATNQSGLYFCAASTSFGTNNTRLAVILISPTPVPPIIDTDTTPIGSTNIVGDSITFSVAAHGIPTPAYQWKIIPDTNSLVTNIISGATSPSLALANLTTNQSGKYFVTITNSAAYFRTNSALAVLKVNPSPFLTISTVRGMVDGSYAPTNTTSMLTVQGTVTTWTNMTASTTSLEFYMQDASGGIAVFWSGANPTTNLPPAGAIVRVTGQLSSFNGLLELSPVFGNPLSSVTVISTNNPLPVAQPLPFDPNITGNLAIMKTLESSYFVASNVFLKSEATFSSGSNEGITNAVTHTKTFTNSVETLTFTNTQGQSFTLFVNSATDIPGKSKSSGPVTIYGVLGFFTSAGFEFTPSRYADIISYIRVTNVLNNLVRRGDILTNTFSESILRPTETLTTYVSIADPEGGSVTLTPITGGLPASASWSSVVNGQTGTAIFHFTPVTGDASSNYVGALGVVSTSGNNFTNTFNVYVPTPVEQQIYISEVFANPTANTNSPAYNPLKRANDGAETSVAVDTYIEIVNLSGTDQSLGNWNFGNGTSVLHVFDQFNSLEAVASSNAFVVYGGPANSDPSPPTILGGPSSYTEPMNALESLTLSTNGGVIALHNNKGYLVDRVAYPASALNSALSRFPTINDELVPQAYISTNFTTAGFQYDGGAWNLATKVPAGVTNVTIAITNKQAIITFTADTTLASTLWQINELGSPFKVVFGTQFTNSAATFSVTNLPADHQFYRISTQ